MVDYGLLGACIEIGCICGLAFYALACFVIERKRRK